jgi:hypothetical protein
MGISLIKNVGILKLQNPELASSKIFRNSFSTLFSFSIKQKGLINENY